MPSYTVNILIIVNILCRISIQFIQFLCLLRHLSDVSGTSLKRHRQRPSLNSFRFHFMTLHLICLASPGLSVCPAIHPPIPRSISLKTPPSITEIAKCFNFYHFHVPIGATNNWENTFVIHQIPDSKVHGAYMGPVGPRLAPCWPHEPCYQGSLSYYCSCPICRQAWHKYNTNMIIFLLLGIILIVLCIPLVSAWSAQYDLYNLLSLPARLRKESMAISYTKRLYIYTSASRAYRCANLLVF